jgi:quinoprotein glucose dehydrogenase
VLAVQILYLLLLAGLASAAGPRRIPPHGYRDWRIYGGGSDSIRYSALDQVNRGNVHRLREVWRYDTGDAYEGSEMQCNPIVIDGVLFATSPKLRVIALDAATGKLRWSFDPHEGRQVKSKLRNRGLTYAQVGNEGRLYFAAGPRLYSLNAKTGRPDPRFGQRGYVDLREGLDRDASNLTITLTTPGVVYKDLLIVGSLVSEALPAAPGHIRAYDLRTGQRRWIFRTIPHPGEYGYGAWPEDAWQYMGGANNWAGMSLDEKRGLVFVPTGSAAFDFYGANRLGDNLFANCLLALKAATGERVWHFQFVRHDVWDRDLPAPPSLITVIRDGRPVDAVAQSTKSGHVFVFERETGMPLFPIEYRKVPTDGVDGEALADTQPFPLKPVPFSRQHLTESLLTRRSPEAHRVVRERFRTLRNGGPFTPPSLQGTVIFPGFDGGAEWGGQAFDPETGLYYVNANEMAWILRLVPRPAQRGRQSGRVLYNRYCAACHREDFGGSPPEFPSLVQISARRTRDEVDLVIRKGAGRMPGFAHLQSQALEAITQFVMTGQDTEVAVKEQGGSPIELKYTIDGYNKFLDPDGYPAVAPPWGTLNAINLDTGEYAWTIPFGEFPELVEHGLANTGSENYGGPVVTAGGLLFIGATIHDRKFRAYDKLTGKLLWETVLPAAGNATPAVYEIKGKQYIVIGAGGGKWGAPSGGSYHAFALP